MRLLLLITLILPLSAKADFTYQPWPADAVKTFAKIPVLSEGRIKPMSTVGHFSLLAISGRTSLKFEADGEKHKISATEWLMDVLFRPEVAKQQPVFLVDDSAAITAIGISVTRKGEGEGGKKKRDRFSYQELLPGRSKLAELSSTFARKQSNDETLTPLEEIIVFVGRNVNAFELMASSMTPAHPGKMVNPGIVDPGMQRMAGTIQTSELIKRVPNISMEEIQQRMRTPPNLLSDDERVVMDALKLLYFFNLSANTLQMFPLDDPAIEEWVSPGGLVKMALEESGQKEWAIERLQRLEKLSAASETPADFNTALETFRAELQADADSRGEAGRIAMEVAMYKEGFLDNSKAFFIFAFVLAAASWLSPKSVLGRGLTVGAMYAGIIGFVLLIMVMTMRALISGWWPLTNLYDTFLFISATVFLFGFFFELFNRNRIAISVAIFIPATLLFLAGQFVKLNPDDTLAPLVAVLRSNFWLSTHVTTITMGYSAGLLAALVSHCWLIGQAFNLNTKDKNAYRAITRMTYGIVLFSLLFSLVGTVLGGIWANYSWGRFWGWDPKENGALMIVLWTLVILHARLGGYIRDLGIHAFTIILGMIISFSWFGVNAMGVGLHSYGFAGGIMRALYTFWGIECLFLLMALYIKFRDKLPLPRQLSPAS